MAQWEIIHLPMQDASLIPGLGKMNALEKEMVNHSSIPAWKNSMDRGAWGATEHEVTKTQTRLSTHTARR